MNHASLLKLGKYLVPKTVASSVQYYTYLFKIECSLREYMKRQTYTSNISIYTNRSSNSLAITEFSKVNQEQNILTLNRGRKKWMNYNFKKLWVKFPIYNIRSVLDNSYAHPRNLVSRLRAGASKNAKYTLSYATNLDKKATYATRYFKYLKYTTSLKHKIKKK